jgi:hypothetical protein
MFIVFQFVISLSPRTNLPVTVKFNVIVSNGYTVSHTAILSVSWRNSMHDLNITVSAYTSVRTDETKDSKLESR